MTWVLLALAVVVVVALVSARLTWTARRLDRMHHRLDLAREALRTHLSNRAAVAIEVAVSGVLDPASALLLLEAAHEARAVLAADGDLGRSESALSEILRQVCDVETVATLRAQTSLADDLGDACRKVDLGRRIRNDQVVVARRLRRMRHVRWLRLAGRAPEVTTVEFDAEPPAALGPG